MDIDYTYPQTDHQAETRLDVLKNLIRKKASECVAHQRAHDELSYRQSSETLARLTREKNRIMEKFPNIK